ncbi:MAG: cation diffusion facilitator family transporter [Endomicrobia bacterium]|nr:cation diffusion facilitator family transporter [Bacillota bacterium]MCL1972790.1 cation diffusion facilitator family transporter [Endomicrobiia bacterium]
MKKNENIKEQTVKTAKLSVFSNSVLTLGKLIVGIMIGSVAIISEAVHSFIDLLASFIALFAVKKSSQPADFDHPYGHGKFENVSGTIEALLIFAAAIYIIYEAVSRLINPQPIEMPIIGVLIMLISATVNFIVSNRLFSVAKKANSIALEANGWHLRTDVYTSLGVMFALIIITVSKFFFPEINIYWLDSVTALIVAAMIVKAAYDLTLKSARDLFDIGLPDEEVATVENIIRADKSISGYHDLKTRKAGNRRFVEFHILVAPDMTVLQSHEITRKLEAEIASKLDNALVTVHVEPCDNTCTVKCQSGCLTKYRKI